MIELANDDTRPHGSGAVEVLCQVITDRSALRTARSAVTDTPIMEQSNAPDVLVDPVGGNILAALTDHDGNFAFVVEALGAFRIGYLLLRTGNLVRIFPK